MVNTKILSIFLISTVAACSSVDGNQKLAERTPEQRCLELENRWDSANQSLVQAEGRNQSSWLYGFADTFNPLTNSSESNLQTAKQQEQRTRENYIAFGCMDLNKMQISSAYKTEVSPPPQMKVEPVVPPTQQMPIGQTFPSVSPVSYQSYNPNQYGMQPAPAMGYGSY